MIMEGIANRTARKLIITAASGVKTIAKKRERPRTVTNGAATGFFVLTTPECGRLVFRDSQMQNATLGDSAVLTLLLQSGRCLDCWSNWCAPGRNKLWRRMFGEYNRPLAEFNSIHDVHTRYSQLPEQSSLEMEMHESQVRRESRSS